METTKVPTWTWLLLACALAGASYGTYRAFNRPERTPALRRVADEGTGELAREPLTRRIAAGTAPAPKTVKARLETRVNPNNSDFINQQFPNQVYPEVTMLPDLQRDDPQEYERLLRQNNPDYAKVLDANAEAERRQAEEAKRWEAERAEQAARLAGE